MLGWENLSFWDISLVNGFNLPLGIFPSPSGPQPICQWTPTPDGIRDHCPSELVYYADAPVSYTEVAGCSSACDKYGDEKYCCTGSKDTAEKCGPTRYSEDFKHVCPDAYTYAYDDKTSTFATDTGPKYSYEIVFCPGIFCLTLLMVDGASTEYLGKAGRMERGGTIWALVGICTVLVWFGI
jgi:hypothetical protein